MYVSRITADYWMAKNNLEKAAKILAKEMERRLIPVEQLAAYKKELRDRIEKLNLEFKKCKPLDFSIMDKPNYCEQIEIYCTGVFIMELFELKIDNPTSTQKVYSRPECPFNYCDDPKTCKTLGKCRHR